MTARVFKIAFLIILVVEKVLGACNSTTHSLTWDRFWIAEHINNRTIKVHLGDIIQLVCKVNDSELAADKYENMIMLTEEQHFNSCDVSTTPGVSRRLGVCIASGIDSTIPVTDSPPLANRPSFEAGSIYYFTSFSSGTFSSAYSDVSQGGACALDPPLKLIVSVLVCVESSSIIPTSTLATNITTSTNINVTTAITIVNVMTTTLNSPSMPTPTTSGASGGEYRMPLHLFLLPVFILVR